MAEHVGLSGAELLKKFALRITTPSTKERIGLLQDVTDRVGKSEIPENAVKGIFKYLTLVIGIYQDNGSRRAVLQLVKTIAKTYPDSALKNVTVALTSQAESQKKRVHASRSSSGEALFCLAWTCIIMKEIFLIGGEKNKEELKKLVVIQCGLVYGALAAGIQAISVSTFRKMVAIFSCSDSSDGQYANLLMEVEPSMFVLSPAGLLMKYLTEKKKQALIEQHKKPFLELYIKHILGSRVKPNTQLLLTCNNILRHCTREDFKDQVLPATQKAMLRSPEIILQSIGVLMGGVSIDLGTFAEELAKPLGAQLISKNEVTRAEACKAFQNLAKQCSDSGNIEKLVIHLVGVLNGSEGKLTVADQRISVLQALGNVSVNTVSGANTLQNLSTTVAEKFIPFLQAEAHEGTLIHALNMLSLWCVKFYTCVPDKLMQWFKKGLTLKTSTSPVRNAYIQCMNASFHGDTLPQAIDMISILIQTMEKANSQSSQSQLVSEAVSAACILAKLSLVDIQAETKLGPFWGIVLDSKKQLLLNEKFLSSVAEDVLCSIVSLSEKLILEYPQKMTEKVSRPYYHAIVFCLTHKSWSVRKHTANTVKRILSLLGGATISLSLVEEFSSLLLTQKVIDPEVLSGDNDKENVTDISKFIKPVILCRALLALTNVEKADPKDSEAIAMATLLPAHHECIVQANSSVWTDILYQLNLDARKFIQKNAKACINHATTDQSLSQSCQCMVSTLARIGPEFVFPDLMMYTTQLLDNPELMTITKDEFGMFKCKDGELYDQTLLSQFEKSSDGQESNVRRENKLYSFKEQMAEIELRKELEKKKGKPAKEPVKLSKKQEEMLQAQREKEADVRKRLSKLNDEVTCACQILQALQEGNLDVLSSYMKTVCNSIVPLFKSPLAADMSTKVFLSLSKALYDDELLGSLVSNVTVRLLEPQCVVNQEWTIEAPQKQGRRVIQMLFEQTVKNSDDDSEIFPSAVFVLAFYLLRVGLEKGGEAIGKDEITMVNAIKIIMAHAGMRQSKDGEKHNPKQLPHYEMIQLLLHVIGTASSKIQQLAGVTLVEVCLCISGEEECATASDRDIRALLQALMSSCTACRDSSLQGLQCLISVLPSVTDNYELGLEIAQRVWVASYDGDENVKRLAESLRVKLQLEEPYDELWSPLIEDVIHPEEIVRQSAAKALEKTLSCNPDSVPAALQELISKYEEKLYIPPPVLDSFGRPVGDEAPDLWPARSGIALALQSVSPLLTTEQISELFQFYVPKALGDRAVEVRTRMRDAALSAVNTHGQDNVNTLLPVFEEFLSSAPDTASFDAVRQSIVILMGSLAKHLDKDNPKIKPIVAQLIGALSTPSQEVQEAVANCLPPLVPGIKQNAPELVQKLMQLLLESENYGERRGAAYGLAGLVRGLGITALKQLEIMSTLEQAVKDKKNPRRREGALFAYEMLCTMLGKLFEPYVVHILPHLLLCFGDNSQYVRQAADDTSKGVMSMLTAHGVKLVLPSLLKGLEEDAWRTKAGAVELLGAMAFCAPKQLSACLPSIVPKLGEVLADSHVKVQMAGAQALKQIGSVIRNPEIQAIVPVLLEALQEPTKKTNLCLQSLLETKFVHFIDAPSLALIMPVVERAFQDRNTETRKMAAQIIGNMYSLTDQKDLDPYIEKVIPGLKQSLLDPVPEVRTVSAKALGAMVKGMGGAKFDELLKWLMETLKSEQSSVDRSGAAQGLSEVIGGLGVSELQRLMPGIIQTAERPDIPSHVRDGYIMLYIYLPGVFEKNFLDYIGLIIPSILQALADESEFVRDTALRAGQRIINMYADTAIELLLPELENGLFDDNWRIRYSSVQLLGDLLYKISGVSGKMTTETAHEDDNFGTESSQKVIMHALGKERRNRVLAGLYMGRSDTALLVRQSALHVWKIIVAHTPQTLREILGTLFSLLLGCLASTSHDKRQVAARTLGDLVKKLGERVLPEIIPILEKGLDSKEADQRQGVCIGLSEIMSATSKDHVTVFADSLIPTVRRALIDPLPEVRVAAAQTFDNLHANISQRALDEILPDLLSKLEDPVLSEAALDGLKQVMMVKSRVVLPYLIPQLITPPVNTRALSFLSSVAGDSLSRHLGKVLPALMSSLSQAMNTPNESEELENCRKVVLSVEDDIGVRTIMQELMSATNTSSTPQCWAAVNMLHTFCDQTEADYSDYLPQLFRGLIGLFVKKEERVLQASWDCLNSVTKKLDVTDMLQHIADVRQAVRFALSDFKGKELPGFSLPKKGIAPVLPIFREGILNGSQDMKAQAADGLGELINVTSAEALKPSVVNITGPLIRILGDRFTWQVKVAVLETLTLLLAKVGAQLKPFLPQLQTTFLKALNDPQRSVRLKAASALGRLIVIHIRVDPLFTELHTGIKNATDTSVKDTMLQALRFCVVGAGKKMAEGTRKGIMGTLLSIMGCQEDSTRSVASGCVGAMCGILPSEELADVMIQHLLESDSSLDWTLRHARGIALGVALKESPEELDKYGSDVKKVITTLATADRIPLSLCGYRAAAYVVRKQVERSEDDPNIMALIVKGMKHESNDVKQLVTQIVTFVSQDGTPLPITTVKTLIPALVMGTKEKNSMVRSNSEYALISILQLRKDDSLLTKILTMLDTGMKDSLNEVVHKSLNKLCKQPPLLDEDIDDTVLK